VIQNVLRHLGGIENYGIISLCLFCTVFSAVLIWALLQKRPHLNRMAKLPLESDAEHDEAIVVSRPETMLVLSLVSILAFSL
jgi:hypothetical protein